MVGGRNGRGTRGRKYICPRSPIKERVIVYYCFSENVSEGEKLWLSIRYKECRHIIIFKKLRILRKRWSEYRRTFMTGKKNKKVLRVLIYDDKKIHYVDAG